MTTATNHGKLPAISNLDPNVPLDYNRYIRCLDVVKARLGRPLTLSEKILYSHLEDPERQEIERGKSYLRLRPDRIAMQDATAQVPIVEIIHVCRWHCFSLCRLVSPQWLFPPPSTVTT